MATINLQSSEHRDLLDIIDKMRSQGITRWIDLPEIIVCGDQSSGKSSVLEAISGMSFPTKDNLCTRFATELVLRRSDYSGIKISIIPDPTRPEREQDQLRAHKFDLGEPPNLGQVVDNARVIMGLDGTNKVFGTDILRVELSGPDQPHLTMVDLPGLFQAGNREQSGDDAKVVRQLVKSYMGRPRSIILAVVSAKSDFALQEITALARDLDRPGERTLGLITKPDTLDVGSDSERAYLELAQNKDVRFRLGWHVLKNRDYAMREATSAERDRAEEEFLSKGVWKLLEPAQLGVKTLRPRLSGVLRNQILLQLPSLLGDVESGIEHCNTILAKLGAPRSTLSDQKRYLATAGHDFSVLMQAALLGDYTNNAFFGDVTSDEGYNRRLRAIVQNTLTDMATEMLQDGQARDIVEKKSGHQKDTISRDDFIDEVKDMMKRSRGRELPGTWNPIVVGELFRQQCTPWKTIINKYVDRILDAVHGVINDTLEYVSVAETTDGIHRDIVNSKMDLLTETLRNKIIELLHPHFSGHPITYNHYLTENVQKVQNERRIQQIKVGIESYFQGHGEYISDTEPLVRHLTDDTEPDMERFASSSAIDYMEAYYKVALKKITDDVAALAVEPCLIDKLPTLFSSSTVFDLSDTEVQNLVGESDQVVEERAQLSQKLKVLQDSLRSLKLLDKHGAAASASSIDHDASEDATTSYSDDSEEAAEELGVSYTGSSE